MRRLPPLPPLLLTVTVALATVFALALPEGIGGRDSVVRLTRGGMQRLGHPDTVSHDHDDSDTAAGDPGGGDRTDVAPAGHDGAAVAILPAPPLPVAPSAGLAQAARARLSPLASTTPPPSRGRAPPRS